MEVRTVNENKLISSFPHKSIFRYFKKPNFRHNKNLENHFSQFCCRHLCYDFDCITHTIKDKCDNISLSKVQTVIQAWWMITVSETLLKNYKPKFDENRLKFHFHSDWCKHASKHCQTIGGKSFFFLKSLSRWKKVKLKHLTADIASI